MPISFLLQVQGDAEFQTSLRSAGGAFQSFGKEADAVAVKAEVVDRNYKQAALGLTAAGASAFSLYSQFDNLEKVELRVDKAHKSQESSALRLNQAQLALDKLVNQGVTSGNEYETALTKVEIAQQQNAIATQQSGIAQNDLSQSQLQFALNIVPQMIGMVSSASLAVKGLGLSTALTGVQSAIGATGVSGFATSVRMAMIAIGPIGWILIGIGAALTIVATNAFGVRDALNAFGKTLGDLLPWLKPVLEALGKIGDWLGGVDSSHAKDQVGEFQASADEDLTHVQNSFANTGEAVGEFQDGVGDALGSDGVSGSFDSMSKSAENALNEVKGYLDKAVDSMTKKTDDLRATLEKKFELKFPDFEDNPGKAKKAEENKLLDDKRRQGLVEYLQKWSPMLANRPQFAANQLSDMGGTSPYSSSEIKANREINDKFAGISSKVGQANELLLKDQLVRNLIDNEDKLTKAMADQRTIQMNIDVNADASLKVAMKKLQNLDVNISNLN